MIQELGKTGTLYTFVGTEPYTRKDGQHTVLRVWKAECAKEGCGREFTIRTSAEGPIAKNNNSGRKHCDQHKAKFEDFRKMAVQNRRAAVDVWKPEIHALRNQGLSAREIELFVPLHYNTIRAILRGLR